MSGLDVFRLSVALALTPVILGIGRRIRIPGARIPFLIGFVAIVVALGTSVAQPLWDTAFLKASRHIVFATGGFCFAWAAWEARKHVLRTSGER